MKMARRPQIISLNNVVILTFVIILNNPYHWQIIITNQAVYENIGCFDDSYYRFFKGPCQEYRPLPLNLEFCFSRESACQEARN
jgi:hypothetical protein